MTAPLVEHPILEYPGGYTRSIGPALSRYFGGLRDGKIVGVRLTDGRVMVPPTEYDPNTAAALDEYVEVGPAGTVVSFCPNSGISQYVHVHNFPRVERSTSSVPSCRHFAHTIRRGKNTSPQFGHLLPSNTGGASGSSGIRKYPSSIGTRAMDDVSSV